MVSPGTALAKAWTTRPSREAWGALVVSDPFCTRDAAQPVRVIVTGIPEDKHVQYHAGWRGIVAAALPGAKCVKVAPAYLKEAKVTHCTPMVLKEHL